MNWYFKVLKKYAVFDGRASRKEYWMFFLFNMIIAFVIGCIEGLVGIALEDDESVLGTIYALAVLCPTIAVGVRRMHDTELCGWWLLAPFVNLVFLVTEGTQGFNKYGPNPKAGSKVNEGDSDGYTALLKAVSNNQNREVIMDLIKAVENINKRDSDGSTALLYASSNNQNPEVVKALIEAGADVKNHDSDEWTPLMLALRFNQNPEVALALIKMGSNINDRTSDEWTPLMLAAKFNQNPEVITILLKSGADGKLKSNEGKTAFDYAKDNENIKGTTQYWELNDAQYK